MNQIKTLSASRRSLLKWGLCGFGGLMISTLPKVVSAQSNGIATLTFEADDVGILNFALLLEELEAAFYAAAADSGMVTDSTELEYIRVLGAQEAAHVTFLRGVLGDQVLFETEDISFNPDGLAAILSDRDTILNTAVALEDVGVHAYNGAGLFLTNPTYLLAAGSIVSVEARHAGGVRALLGRPTTQPDSDRLVPDEDLVASLNPFKGRAYDELYSPNQVVSIVGSLNLINNPINGALVA
ncbi:ferritin-like domain-containing protein [Leptolyngbya sp. BC1307]|uniref:ferritin-like domain-containing protein n=1 Tax=Leptolyngbya sp. BC1307 TaxID=2029589 RepID=UPI000EFC685E|nr:ferritin-like domain-containing protein [Leptolyngbya sp. BC1307]